MTDPGMKHHLRNYLQRQREALLWKLEGVGERKARMPMTGTGSNLLGIVKHVASVESGYLGGVFGRPGPDPLPWMEESAALGNNADMWATEDQTIEWVGALYRRVWAHSDRTVSELPLDAEGFVPWWGPERGRVTLGQILVHVIAETARHLGHCDILREQADGAVGYCAPPAAANIPAQDPGWWESYNAGLKTLAESFPE
ncbi:MAG: DinB family protein [Bifidobacteriaceae bacterium]|jgi:uncharacterized damage-inducible protein DinB|nr:DinB family protein [Bifidobacteriaceae bacterium]